MLYLGLLVRFIGEEKDKNGETVLYIAVVTIIVLSIRNPDCEGDNWSTNNSISCINDSLAREMANENSLKESAFAC